MLFLYAKLTAICMKKHTNEKKKHNKKQNKPKKEHSHPPTPQKINKNVEKVL